MNKFQLVTPSLLAVRRSAEACIDLFSARFIVLKTLGEQIDQSIQNLNITVYIDDLVFLHIYWNI